MIEITLTEEQWDDLCNLTIDNLHEPMNYLHSLQNKWWEDTLGYKPTRVDRLKDKTFQITK